MVDYSTLLLVIGHLSTACSAVWVDPTLPWPAIFIADFIQNDITTAQFLEMMGLSGPEYLAMGQCIVDAR